MRRYSFGTFLVDDGNRALYETCRSIASLSYRGRLPVVLVAPDGHGKTHLLYSIVNRARSGPARTGVAFVSADEFPVEVRRLTRNPGPIERARNAILLVDDLHRFRHQLEELDVLVDLFLKHGHYVVLSSAVPLSSVGHLPASLMRRLDRGHCFQAETGAALPRPAPAKTPALDTPNLQPQVDALRKQCENAQNEVQKTRQEIEQLKAENALLKVSAREVGPLREQLETLQDRLDQPAAEPDAPEVHPGRQQAGAVLEKAAALLQEVQQSRTRLARIREQSRIFEPKDVTPAAVDSHPVPADEPVPVSDPAQRALEEALAERDELRAEREKLQREIDTLRRSVARANEERDETRRHLRTAFEKLDRYEKNLTELRSQMEQHSGEKDAAIEERVQAQNEAARVGASAVSEGLHDVQAQFAAGLRMIDRMATRLDALCAALDGSEVEDRHAGEAEPFFVTPTEQESKTEAPVDKTDSEPAFIPGIGAAKPSAEHSELPAHVRREDNDWTPRRSLHHIEELSEPGLFSYPEEYDSSI